MEHVKRLAIGLLVLAAVLALAGGLIYLVLNFGAAPVVLLGVTVLAAAYAMADVETKARMRARFMIALPSFSCP